MCLTADIKETHGYVLMQYCNNASSQVCSICTISTWFFMIMLISYMQMCQFVQCQHDFSWVCWYRICRCVEYMQYWHKFSQVCRIRTHMCMDFITPVFTWFFTNVFNIYTGVLNAYNIDMVFHFLVKVNSICWLSSCI